MQNSKFLDQLNKVEDLRKLDKSDLVLVAEELRKYTIETVAHIGGHLGAGLGVVEITVALHYVFDTPRDVIIWDVGHQSYPHKILTDRKDRIHTLRQKGGISGFTKKTESEFDVFGAGHSSTSISAALGIAKARSMKGENKEVIAVIGDGAMSAGMAYEAMNNAGSSRTRMFVILNDNEMSISPAVGAMNKYLAKIISSKSYLTFRNSTKKLVKKLPKIFSTLIKKTERNTKDLFNNGNFFEEMGFYYIGPIDGHNVNDMVSIFENIRDDKTITRPVLLHIITEKGRGFVSPDVSVEKYHAVAKFDLLTGIQKKSTNSIPTYTQVFSEQLIRLGHADKQIVAITAAMASGTGLDKFAKIFPDRMFDVGIAEQHAVTFAAGLSCEGFKPYVAIYSTFLQRAYDQIIHDVVIQNLPVRFILDRAGVVGNDGPTHAGSFDLAYLLTLPNVIVMAPSDEAELSLMIQTSYEIDNCPSFIRFPRGAARGAEVLKNPYSLQIGKGKIIREGKKIAVLNLGTRLKEVEKLAEHLLTYHDINITIADARFAKPFDTSLVANLAMNHEILLIIEEGSSGGFGSHVVEYLVNHDLMANIVVRTLHYPDYFIEHQEQEEMNIEAGLCFENMLKIIKEQIFKADKIRNVA